MSTVEKIYEFGVGWEATRLIIERKGGDDIFSFSVNFVKGGDVVELEFSGLKDVVALPELIDVEHIVVSKKISPQKEFGTIKVEFLGEHCLELWCDTVKRIS